MNKSVCVVGAGPAGVAAAKALIHNAPKGEFKVSIFEAQHAIGGLWPTSKTDSGRQVHPLMVANQSKHTMHFSDLAWEPDTPQYLRAWRLGQYLEKYHDRYLAGHPDFELKLNTRVTRATRRDDGSGGWQVTSQSKTGEQTSNFDYLVVASGYFGKPVIPENLANVPDLPVVHSCHYRNLKGLLGTEPRKPGKILVVGGQMSGVEIAATIATHLSSATHSPGKSEIPDVEQYTVHHVIQKPVWVFPLFTSPDPKFPAAPFLPLDYAAYNRSNRVPPLADTSGHISEAAAKVIHGLFGGIVGTDQSVYSPLLKIDDEARTKPPYIAVSDFYTEFVRSGLITLSNGKVETINGGVAKISPSGNEVDHVAAVVVATGFNPSPCVDFLPDDVLREMHHSPKHSEQTLALGLHSTYHPNVPNLGFVGFYRAAYWGSIQMQSRILAQMWSGSNGDNNEEDPSKTRIAEALKQKLQTDKSIQRTLALRDDSRCSQFPMGDYQFLMQDLSEALAIDIHSLSTGDIPSLSHNNLPLDMLTPSRYPSQTDSLESRQEAETSLQDAKQVAIQGLTTPRFVARAVFRSLLGTWKLERDLKSKLPSHPSGHFSGTACFLLRDLTSDGVQCAADASSVAQTADEGMEYLYIEDGEFKTEQGFGFHATRRYIYRYDETRDVLSVWFTKPEDEKRADYLFHEVEFLQPREGRDQAWEAKAGHLCIDDYYDVNYNFAFKAVNLEKWGIEYTVKGPKKDYTIQGRYTR